MIVGICERFHDDEPKLYMLDTAKLDSDKMVDLAIIMVAKIRSERVVFQTGIVATSKDIRERLEAEKYTFRNARVNAGPAERLIDLVIQFE